MLFRATGTTGNTRGTYIADVNVELRVLCVGPQLGLGEDARDEARQEARLVHAARDGVRLAAARLSVREPARTARGRAHSLSIRGLALQQSAKC